MYFQPSPQKHIHHTHISKNTTHLEVPMLLSNLLSRPPCNAGIVYHPRIEITH